MNKFMNLFERYIVREISSRTSFLILLSMSALFIFLSSMQFFFHMPVIGGLFAQFQVLITILLTIRLPIKGFVCAILLNLLTSLLAVFSFLFLHDNMILPAIFVPLFTNFTLTLIHILTLTLSKRISDLSDKNKTLTRLNAELSETRANLEQQNHILQSYSRIINENEDRLSHLAFYDRLTNLPNRKYLIERIEALCAFSKEHHVHFYILFIDLNSFRKVNDVFGYQAGDYVLKSLAKKMNSFVHSNDLLARLDSDAFCLLVRRNLNKSQLEEYAQSIRMLISEPISYGSQSITVAATLGFDTYPQDGDITDQLFKRVNVDLPDLKNNPETIHFFSPYLP